MTLQQIAIILKARWRSSLVVLLGVTAAVAAVSVAMPRKYAATSTVVLEVKSSDPVAMVVMPGMSMSGYIATQVDVLRSERVALKVVDELRLTEDGTFRDDWTKDADGEGNLRVWIAGELIRRLEVVPARESNVISVTYTARSRPLAPLVANTFVKAYIDTVRELRVEPAKQYNAFFDERAKQLRDALEQAQSRLSAYQREKGITATDERLDVENARLAELMSQMVSLQGIEGESNSRLSAVKGNAERLPEVLASPLIASLTSELVRQQARLEEMTQNFGDSYPKVIELRASNSQLRRRIDSEVNRVAGSMAVSNSVNVSRVAQLRRAIEDQRAKLLTLKGQRDDASVLQRDVENAQKAYEAIAVRADQSSTESRNNQTNVSILKTADLPVRASSPRVGLNIVLALVVGSLLGILTAIFREQRDQRLRSDDDVARLGTLLIGSLPLRKRPSEKAVPPQLNLARKGVPVAGARPAH